MGSATPRRIPPFWSRSKHGGNPSRPNGLAQCVLLRDSPPLAPKGRGRPWCLGRYRGLSLCISMLRWRVMAPTEKRPPHRGGHDGADKPEHNLVHHCFASERRRHCASLQALGTIRCRPPAGQAVLRASAALDQMRVRSPELGRSPFWGRSSRAPPDPEDSPDE
jgi:hypothetical protein